MPHDEKADSAQRNSITAHRPFQKKNTEELNEKNLSCILYDKIRERKTLHMMMGKSTSWHGN